MRTLLFIAVACLSTIAHAQEPSPYAGEQSRAVSSLSENEIEGLRNGRGMGMARLAELNSYPGPRHVLELTDELELSDEQIEATQLVFAEMRSSAVATGAEIIEAERRLDAQFATRDVDPESLAVALTEIGVLRARLRYVHLEAHLRMAELLTDEQIDAYDRLRGYGDGSHEHRRHGGQH